MMNKKQKLWTMLLGSSLLSSYAIHGDIAQRLDGTSDEKIYETTIFSDVDRQQQATKNTVRDILNTLPIYKDKSELEKDTFVNVFAAILLSAAQATDCTDYYNRK